MSKSYEFFLPGPSEDPKVAVIDRLRGVKRSWELKQGVRMKGNFSPRVEVTLDPSRGSLLTDFLHNRERVVAISERARALFEAEGLDEKQVEYLPFVLKNKKGRKVEAQYCLANPLRKVKCMDRERSDFLTLGDGKTVDHINVLHVLTDKVPKGAKFFRLGEQPEFILYRSDLIERIREEGLTGLNLTAMGEEIWT